MGVEYHVHRDQGSDYLHKKNRLATYTGEPTHDQRGAAPDTKGTSRRLTWKLKHNTEGTLRRLTRKLNTTQGGPSENSKES